MALKLNRIFEKLLKYGLLVEWVFGVVEAFSAENPSIVSYLGLINNSLFVALSIQILNFVLNKLDNGLHATIALLLRALNFDTFRLVKLSSHLY